MQADVELTLQSVHNAVLILPISVQDLDMLPTDFSMQGVVNVNLS